MLLPIRFSRTLASILEACGPLFISVDRISDVSFPHNYSAAAAKRLVISVIVVNVVCLQIRQPSRRLPTQSLVNSLALSSSPLSSINYSVWDSAETLVTMNERPGAGVHSLYLGSVPRDLRRPCCEEGRSSS